MPSWECKVSSFICEEVDLILGDAEIALEIKSSENVPGRTKGLHPADIFQARFQIEF